MKRKSSASSARPACWPSRPSRPSPRRRPTDPLRVVEIPAGEPVVIGTWGVQSGADASLGQDWMNSVAIAADDRDNEFMGHPIEIVTEDGLCTP